MVEIAFVAIAGLLGYWLGRYRSYCLQNRGEALVARCLSEAFSAPEFHLLNNVTLRVKDGTTQIDHILVSRHGIFVIETKDYKGWIFANPKHPTWAQVIFKRKYKFQNPIYQNFKHVRAVQRLLDFLPKETISSVVVFAGKAEFKTPLPEGVYTINSLLGHIRSQNVILLSENRMQFCVGRLETARLALTKKTDVQHRESLQRRFGDTT